MIRVFIALFCAALLAPLSAHALSESEYQAMLKRSPFFREADQELTQTWKDVNKTLKQSDKKFLLKDQRQWLKSGRDEDAEPYIQEGMSRDCAYYMAWKKRISSLSVFQYNAGLSKEDQDAGRARADDYYFDESDAPAECVRER